MNKVKINKNIYEVLKYIEVNITEAIDLEHSRLNYLIQTDKLTSEESILAVKAFLNENGYELIQP